MIFLCFILTPYPLCRLTVTSCLKIDMIAGVDPLEEEVGLDISHHRGSAYDLTEPHKEHVEQLMEVRASRHGKIEVPSEVEKAATDHDA